MTGITFGRLQDLAPREAWAHEALAFTPWLAANIDRLSEAVGLPLEVTGTEMAVDTFSADILARNPADESVVLIENQLEQTDHTHLGQIMTYLAGLEAKTVIWIAPKFREPHLSAVRWLNQHTAAGFSFFAVRLRVVRIGESPYAPIFEVVEKPNGWERRLEETGRKVTAESPIVSERRRAFWRLLLERHPDLAALGIKVNAEGSKWLPTPIPDTIIGLYLSSQTCGIYIRGQTGIPIEAVAERLAPFADEITAKLGAPLQDGQEVAWLFVAKIAQPLSDEPNWSSTTDWMAERLRVYARTLAELANRLVHA